MSRQKIDPEIFWGASKSNSFPVEKRDDVRNSARLQAAGQWHELSFFSLNGRYLTNSKFSASNRPLSLILSFGITKSAMNEIVMNGDVS